MITSQPISSRSSPQPDERISEIQGLLENVVGKLSTAAGGGQARMTSDETEKIILDLQVAGVRCLFIEQLEEPAREQVMLSPRERTIARLVAAGHPNKSIAHVLTISTWTVNTHLRRIFAKLGVGSRAAMVAHLMDAGGMREPEPKE